MIEFSDFLVGLKSRLAPPGNSDALDGVFASRRAESGNYSDRKLTQAAVALVLRRRLSEAELLIIKRSESERDRGLREFSV